MNAYWRAATIAAAFLATTPLAAQQSRDRDRDDDYRTRIDTTLAFERGGTVDLSLISGEIKVDGWDRNEVKIQATSERGLLRLESSPSRIRLDVRSDRGEMGDTRYEVTVPNSARVLTRSVSGDITTRGGAEVEAHSVSGDVTVSDVAGRATLESVSGGVEAMHVGGGLRVNAVSGDLRATDVTGDVDAQTVSGELTLQDIKSSYVTTETVSGDLRFSGKVDPKGRYEFHAHSGDVRIALPSGIPGASFSVQTFSGDIDSGCQMTLQPSNENGGRHQRRIEFTLGNGGGAKFTIETFSGDVTIEGCPGSRREE
jgi:DUF4097 and DUF4098 domain-containing protein YvlB